MNFEPAVYLNVEPTDTAWCCVFVQGKLLMPAPEDAVFAPQPRTLLEQLGAGTTRHYLGRLDGIDCWAVRAEAVPEGFRPLPLRAAMMAFDAPLLGLASRAAQVLEWERTHRHCGVCGTPTEQAERERARRCPACGHTAYPRLSPAMMCLVTRGREVLLAKALNSVTGMYSALAGFVEPGESLEECVHREVAEEVGLQVKNLRYYGSQSWPFPHSLMVAYTAEWAAGDIVRQEEEIADAQWFPIDQLPPIPPRFSIAGHLIRDTVEALR
jgi:NAD+ diphosphatase